ncbi:NACHT domain-containing protein [Streptomyces sp. NPDC050803]|uniref:NACHT domain-containing protein n=1 Tax=unclassified Streptomyces TaxID=2593676 RepID=UPI00343110E6
MRHWRRGLWAGAVLATGALVAVTVRDGSLEATGPLLSVLGFFVSLAGLLLNTVRPTAAATADAQADRSADALATAVQAQWREEWRLRRLQDPEPLAVRWAPAQAWLSDLDGAIGWPPRDGQRPDLGGQLPEITQVFGYVPSRRLVVLGAPGSGKTVLAVRFTLDLLDRRGAEDPVPVVFQTSTWQPDRQSLHDWLADRLIVNYPTLAAEGASGAVAARELVTSGRILPVLDGLDEMPPPLRTAAVRRLNAELDTGAPLLLTCRSAVYAEVVEAGDVLTAAAVVELQPLGFDEAADFLLRTARPVRGPAGERATAWDPVLAHVRLHPDAPVSRCLREVLSLPLMVAMARAVYGDTGADPAELLHRPELATPATLEQHLLDAFVPASFRTSERWDSEDAVHWLRFLARHLERRQSRDLAWWELPRALPGALDAVGPLLLLGAAAELVCLVGWTAAGWDPGSFIVVAAVCVGLCAGHMALSHEGAGPVRRLLLPLACVIPLGVIIGAFQPLTWDPYVQEIFVGLNGLVGQLAGGALYGVSVAITLAAIGLTGAPTPAMMPFPVLRSSPYGRWVWRAVCGLTAGWLVYVVTGLLVQGYGPGPLVAAVGAGALAAYVVRGEGADQVRSGERRHRRRGNGHARRFARALARGLATGMLAGTVLGLAFALAEGGTASSRAALRSEFPVPGPVQRTADGGRHVVADDGTRYGIRPDGIRYVKPGEPLHGAVVEGTDPGDVTFLMVNSGRPAEACEGEEGRCRPLTAAVELSVNSDFFLIARLPDGRSAVAYYVDDGEVEDRHWDWMARQDDDDPMGVALEFGLTVGLGLGIVAGVAAGLHRWLGAPVDIARTPSPLASLRTDRETGIVRGVLTTFVGLFAAALLFVPRLDSGYVASLVFLPTGLVTLALTAWGRLLTARLWLCTAGRLPWRLMAFLAEAHRRGVLRQAGAVYQFRHARLQERLAAPPEEAEVRSPAGPPVRPAAS